jgi:enamine deaminase RidA (YjgF/YER057c/UK114 family)
MRKRLFHWRGQRFVYLFLEGEPGLPVDRQSQGLFDRAGAELKSLGLDLGGNVVRNRVFGRTREDRDTVSTVRGKNFSGQSRAATSSFISPAHLSSAADVALDLIAMAAPPGGAARKVVEHDPPQPFIRYLTWGPLVFLAGMTCEHYPTLQEQCTDILPRAHALLKENGCDWRNVQHVSFFLQQDEKADALFRAVTAAAPVPLDSTEIEFVEGYSRPNKLVEIEITAAR